MSGALSSLRASGCTPDIGCEMNRGRLCVDVPLVTTPLVAVSLVWPSASGFASPFVDTSGAPCEALEAAFPPGRNGSSGATSSAAPLGGSGCTFCLERCVEAILSRSMEPMGIAFWTRCAFSCSYFCRLLNILWSVGVVGLAQDVTSCAQAGAPPKLMVLLDW